MIKILQGHVDKKRGKKKVIKKDEMIGRYETKGRRRIQHKEEKQRKTISKLPECTQRNGGLNETEDQGTIVKEIRCDGRALKAEPINRKR